MPRATSASGPSEILPGVFVGAWKDAVSFQGERICVLDDRPEDAPAEERIRIYDDAKDAPIVANLDRVAKRVDLARASGRSVLIFCGHGVRRSPMAGAWYLHRSAGLTLDEAYEWIRARRPQVEPARDWVGHWEALEERAREPSPKRRR
jgi:protein-tyrosine phosphatase